MIMDELMEKLSEMSRGGSLLDTTEVKMTTPDWEERGVREIEYELDPDYLYYDVQKGVVYIHLDIGATYDQVYNEGYNDGKRDMQSKLDEAKAELSEAFIAGFEKAVSILENTIQRIRNED